MNATKWTEFRSVSYCIACFALEIEHCACPVMLISSSSSQGRELFALELVVLVGAYSFKTNCLGFTS